MHLTGNTPWGLPSEVLHRTRRSYFVGVWGREARQQTGPGSWGRNWRSFWGSVSLWPVASGWFCW